MNLKAKTDHTLFEHLDAADRELIGRIAADYRLTHQELRELCEIACDLRQWCEISFLDLWRAEEEKQKETGTREAKKRLILCLRKRMDEFKESPTKYSRKGSGSPKPPNVRPELTDSDKQVYGMCPVYSEETVCCNLHTIDAVENCGFGCSYCTIQGFYDDPIRFDNRFKEKLENISIDPERSYHIGTGQSSDSLMWGNRNGLLEDLCKFARSHSNVLLEFKTKSDNISYFLTQETPPNIVISWSLNTETIIHNEEHYTAGLERRLSAARKIADRGIRIAFHFHPMVFYKGWDEEYLALAEIIKERFCPEEVLFVSFGSLTFIKPVLRQIRERGEKTKILQVPLVSDPKGKLTYPDHIKVEMFTRMYRALAHWQGKVFMYLCMEKQDIWKQSLGYVYPDNEAFEADFRRRTMSKLAV